jgi:hypothetical protein
MRPATIDKKEHQAVTTVYCPLCTHTVQANVAFTPRSAVVVPGQKCPRCSSSLDAGYVFGVNRAA